MRLSKPHLVIVCVSFCLVFCLVSPSLAPGSARAVPGCHQASCCDPHRKRHSNGRRQLGGVGWTCGSQHGSIQRGPVLSFSRHPAATGKGARIPQSSWSLELVVGFPATSQRSKTNKQTVVESRALAAWASLSLAVRPTETASVLVMHDVLQVQPTHPVMVAAVVPHRRASETCKWM